MALDTTLVDKHIRLWIAGSAVEGTVTDVDDPWLTVEVAPETGATERTIRYNTSHVTSIEVLS